MLHSFFARDRVDLPQLAEHLERLPPPQRVLAIRSLTRRQQAQLYEAAQGFRPLTLDDFVPQQVPPRTWVIHEGRNTLPLFRFFQKRFLRPEPNSQVLWGYNWGPTMGLVGPGYFLVCSGEKGEVLIDYTRIPPETPPSSPRLRPNSSGLSFFVYHNMIDIMRGVSLHVTIGRATRKHKPLDAWFVLCRIDPETGPG